MPVGVARRESALTDAAIGSNPVRRFNTRDESAYVETVSRHGPRIRGETIPPFSHVVQGSAACLDTVSTPAWSETELTDAIVTVCDESHFAPMLACWRALEHCRRFTPRGTPESLRSAMRTKLRDSMASPAGALRAAA